MSDISPLRPAAQQCVTASDLVRHFGIWQERAARAPVYILHRGRPRFALTSLDVMEALCAPHDPATGGDSKLAALLDAIDEVAFITDEGGAIVASSRTARARFGEAARPGADPAALATAGGGFLSDAVARVAANGVSEQVEIVPARYPARRVACTVSPFPAGCLIRARDLTADEQLAIANARATAIVEAAQASGMATMRIGLRGYLIDPPATFARLIGVAREALETARLASLVAVSGRVAVGEAIEGVIGDAVSRTVATSLLVRGAAALPVTIGLAALHPAGRVEEIVATIIAVPESRP